MDERTPAATAAEWIALGERHLAAREVVDAATCYERAVELDPSVPERWARLGRLHLAIRRFDAAEVSLARAASLAPHVPELHTLLACALREQNRVDAAIAACERALRLDPHFMYAAVAEALMLPPIYAHADDVQKWRARFAAGLERLHRRLPEWRSNARQILELDWTNFLLAYQGENDAELQTSYANWVAALLGAAVPQLQTPIATQSARRDRIHVGFVSSEFRRSTVGDYFLRWITDLPRDRFHVTTIYTGQAVDDRTVEAQRSSDRFAHVAGRADEIAGVARDCHLDIALYPDVGMSAKSILLANLRLAPVQIAGWGHPVTTGSAFVDAYLSCAAMEPPHASAHYRETLLALPGIGVRYRAPDCTKAAARNALGLPQGKHLYLCPQSLCKIHPDNDAIFLDLVERDPDALIVFFAGQSSGQTQAFGKRLESGLRARNVPPRRQMTFLPRMSREDFLSVMHVCDVMIDTLRWSGGNTTLDALSSTLPVVTLEGRFMRGRQTAAMLRIVGAEELIARDRDHYIELALKVAGDPICRAKLSERIRCGLPQLFDRSEPIAALAQTLQAIAAES